MLKQRLREFSVPIAFFLTCIGCSIAYTELRVAGQLIRSNTCLVFAIVFGILTFVSAMFVGIENIIE